MSPVEPLLRMPVGVVVERRKSGSPWAEVAWQAVAVLVGLPEAAAWTPLAGDGDAMRFYVGAAEIACFRSETDNYRRNLASGTPLLWVALQATGGEAPYEITAVTADPAEGEALTEAGDALVDTVAMPEPVRRAIADFVAEHHVERPFEKRVRDRADPEALARGLRHRGQLDER